jgi:hypothetical protein
LVAPTRVSLIRTAMGVLILLVLGCWAPGGRLAYLTVMMTVDLVRSDDVEFDA